MHLLLKKSDIKYDYEAAEENEISFTTGDKITGITFPSEDWWHNISI